MVVTLGVDPTENPVQVVQLSPVEQFDLLLELELQRLQAGNVDPGAGVLQLPHPPPVQAVLLSAFDILFHRPANLLQLPDIQQAAGLH